MPAHLEPPNPTGFYETFHMNIGKWKPAGSSEWQPLPNRGVTLGVVLPPEGPQPIQWTAQKPEHAEHYHAILTPLRNIWHAFTGH